MSISANNDNVFSEEKSHTFYSLREDYSMRDLQEPEDLAKTLKECFGENFEAAHQDQKLLLISLISFVLFEGGRFWDVCSQWNLDGRLPIEVMGSELNHQKGVELLQNLVNSLRSS
jgi:hypothetical protein